MCPCRIRVALFGNRDVPGAAYVAGSPLAAHVAQANIAAREKLTADTEHVLRKYMTNEGLSFPIAAHLLTALARKGCINRRSMMSDTEG